MQFDAKFTQDTASFNASMAERETAFDTSVDDGNNTFSASMEEDSTAFVASVSEDEDSFDVEFDSFVENNTGSAGAAVLYIPQSLTEAQQAQARENIGAVAQNGVTEAVEGALEEAKESGAFKGDTGQRGTGVHFIRTAPTYVTPATLPSGARYQYRIALILVQQDSGTSEVLPGDILLHGGEAVYPVVGVDETNVYAYESRIIKGDKGDTGATGPQGPQGPAGADGAKGDKGDKGDTGPQGDTGPVGPQGPQGDTGAMGPQGETGPQGAKGEKGDTGATGATGPQGEKGDQGPAGADGAKGDKGDQGEQGPVGDPGPAGADGQRGSRYYFVQTTPSENNAWVNGELHPYLIALDKVISESGASDVIVGDMIVDLESYVYPAAYVDSTWVFLGERSSIRGADGVPGTSITITSVSESLEDGGENVVTFSDGTTLSVRNGNKGSAGEGGSGGAGEFRVTIEGSDTTTVINKTYPVSNTLAEIWTAYTSGQRIMLIDYVTDDGGAALRFEPSLVQSSRCEFYHDFVENGVLVSRGVWVISSNNSGRAKYTETPLTAVNPNALTINGTSYDGSEAVEVTVEAEQEIMAVTLSTDDGGAWTADKTFTELMKAYIAGKLLHAKIDTGEVLQLMLCNDSEIWFGLTVGIAGEAASFNIVMDSSGGITTSVSPISGGGAMFVTFSSEDGETWTADKTFSEVYEAYQNGSMIYANYNGLLIPARQVDSSWISFIFQYYEGTLITFVITLDNTDKVTAEQSIDTVGGDSLLAVTLSLDDAGTVVPTHTSEQIANIASAGRTAVIALSNAVYHPYQIDDDECIFERFNFVDKGLVSRDTVTITGSTVTLRDSEFITIKGYTASPLTINGVEYNGSEAVDVTIDTPTTLPNPQPLTINGQTYDGSEAVDVTIDTPDTYTLPVATADTLGGVKVGTGNLKHDVYNGMLYMQDDKLMMDNIAHNMLDIGKNIINLWPDNIAVQLGTAFKWGPICCFVYQFNVTTAITGQSYGFDVAELPWSPVTRFWLNNSTQFYQEGGHKFIKRNSTSLPAGNYVLSGWYMSNDLTVEV